MAMTAGLPMGIENFKEMRTRGYYYVDKTGLIRDLIKNMGKVNLFTRPRRFGKTLNMSMLKYFFETGCDGMLFEGLEIAGYFEGNLTVRKVYGEISGHFRQLKGGKRQKF